MVVFSADRFLLRCCFVAILLCYEPFGLCVLLRGAAFLRSCVWAYDCACDDNYVISRGSWAHYDVRQGLRVRYEA